jgi:RluA family pseudouridine synthase
VSAGTGLVWNPHRPALSRARLDLPRLFEDDWVLVIDKPAGLLSVPSGPGAQHEDCALARVAAYVRHRHPHRPYVGRVHRLDRDTSGALLFALTPQARATLIETFRVHRIERIYAALVAGEPREEQGTIDAPIRSVYRAGRRGVAHADEPSLPARTHWRVIERFAGAARLEIRLETGRQHQIRAHLAHLDLPILGDSVYRGRVARRPPIPVERPMLHAQRLGFAHPTTGAPVVVEAPPPSDFRAAQARLRALDARSAP